MKSTPIIIGGIVLIAAVSIWFNLPSKNQALAPETTDEVETQTTTNDTGASSEHTAGEHADMASQEAHGTDVGMELPETDMSALDHNSANKGTVDHSTMNMATDSTAKTFKISGKNFVFDVTEMRVKEGDTVTIEFESADGFHDLVIDEFGARTEKVKTGNTSKVTFVASKKGTFEYYCSVGSHRMNGMVGKLIVE